MMESAREEALREKTTATTANFRCRLYRPMRLRLARRPRTRAGPIAREEVGKSCGSLTTQCRNREANLASFSRDQQQLVRTRLFQECGNNLPFLENLDEVQLQRFQFAVLKLSEGKMDKLDEAIELAKVDWRDLLAAAGFEEPDAHTSWRVKADH